MKPYPKYKDSGIEWIGEVPEHWGLKRLKYVTTINPSKENSKISKDSDELVTFLPMEKVNEDGTFATDLKRPINELWNGFTYFEELDTIFAKITPCFENGKGAYLINLGSSVGFGSTEFHVLREIANTSVSKYLYYITRFDLFRKTGESLMIGVAGQKRVPSTFAENFLIGIPPVLEQQSITAYLDHKTTKIDNLISKKQKLIELLKEERAATINQAVTKGLNPDAPMKDSGIEWLGKVPEKWEVKRLKFVSDFKSGNGITANLIKNNGEYAVYGGNGLRGYTASYTHEGSYVLIGRQGALCGNINYADGKFWASEHAVVATLVSDYNLFWFGELLRTMNLNQYSQSAAQPGLSVDHIKNLFISVPSLNEQDVIAAYLDRKTTKTDQTISKIEKQIDLLKEYRTALISEVVTGKIDVRNEGSNG